MAVNIDRPFMNNTGLNKNNCFSNLIHHISPNIENEIDIINHSTYCNADDFRDVLKNNKNELSMLNLNCLNLNTRFKNKNSLFRHNNKYIHILTK